MGVNCNVRGDIGMSVRESRWLRWRYMPMTHVPLTLNLSNLISLDFSYNSKLGTLWAESNPALEACPNLLRLDLSWCTSITTLPNSIRHLTRLQFLDLGGCRNLQKLPTSIGLLTALQELFLSWCRSLEALPDSITALPRLDLLCLQSCSSISKLPTTMGLMTSLKIVIVDLVAEWQALAIGQIHALKYLVVWESTVEAITVLGGSGTLKNLDQLSEIVFYECLSMTKLPETVGVLANLDSLGFHGCEKLQELPNSIGGLKALKRLSLEECSGLATLPDTMGALTSLQSLVIVNCTSITMLPTSIGHLSSLRVLAIDGCDELQALPDSLRELNALRSLSIMGCGSLEGLGALRVLQGLRIWGCTTITELPGSDLVVVETDFKAPFLGKWEVFYPARRLSVEVRVVEANDCGILRQMQCTHSGQLTLQRMHELPCCKLTTV